MKQRIFGWISILVGVVLALALVEVTAIAWLYLEDGHYTSADELFERTQNTYVRDMTKNSDCRYVDTLFPHPYLGFVHHGNPPCGKSWVNNIGEFGDNVPLRKRADRYTILLAGGSVAAQLAQELEPPAQRYLEEALNKRYISPNGQPFLVLNGGDGAWKQPQPFILFSMYVDSVDAVATLGGFNEHYFFHPGTQERLERPLSNFIDVNPFVADENFGDAAVGWVIGRVAGALARVPVLGRSHAAYMVIRGIEAVAKSKDNFSSTKKTTLTSLFSLPPDIPSDPDKLFQAQLGLFQKYERAIDAVAHDNGVKSAHFIQPVPGWGKELTAEEKASVGDLSYIDRYRRMAAGLLALRDRGMAVFDLGDIYKDEKGKIYADDVHCYRDTIQTGPRAGRADSRGYTIMAESIAADLAKVWGFKEKPGN